MNVRKGKRFPMHGLAEMGKLSSPGSFSCRYSTIVLLVASMISCSSAAYQAPFLGEVYSKADKAVPLTQPAASGTGALSIQSATTATAGPTCSGDAQCQALCPADDFTKAQPALTAEAVQQQVGQSPASLRYRHFALKQKIKNHFMKLNLRSFSINSASMGCAER